MDELAKIIVTAVISSLAGGMLGGGIVYRVVYSALVNDLRQTFLSRDDANALVRLRDEQVNTLARNLERNDGHVVALDDRVGRSEQKILVLEERHLQEWKRIAEALDHAAKTQDRTMSEIKEVSEMMHDLALRMERIQQGPPRQPRRNPEI